MMERTPDGVVVVGIARVAVVGSPVVEDGSDIPTALLWVRSALPLVGDAVDRDSSEFAIVVGSERIVRNQLDLPEPRDVGANSGHFRVQTPHPADTHGLPFGEKAPGFVPRKGV